MTIILQGIKVEKKDRPRKQDERMSCWDMTNARENKIRISVIKKKIKGVFLFHYSSLLFL